MDSNAFCKLLIEESLKNDGISEDKRYSAHFEHKDLVKRLLRVKSQRSKEMMIPSLINFNSLSLKLHPVVKSTKRLKSIKKTEPVTQRVLYNESLPKIKPGNRLVLDKTPAKSSRALKKSSLKKIYTKISLKREKLY
jgi:hypothetical protein